MNRGSPGILEVAGRARGHLESWQKWSFPFSPPRPDSGDPRGRRPVRKRRRISRFWLASGQIAALGPQPRCELELTATATSRGHSSRNVAARVFSTSGFIRCLRRRSCVDERQNGDVTATELTPVAGETSRRSLAGGTHDKAGAWLRGLLTRHRESAK